jgi:hypothetical protein
MKDDISLINRAMAVPTIMTTDDGRKVYIASWEPLVTAESARLNHITIKIDAVIMIKNDDDMKDDNKQQ